MKRFYFSALCLFLVFLSSCNGNLKVSEVQERLLGKWYFEGVEFRDKGTMIRKDVSSNWNSYSLEFFYDGILEWIDISKNDTLTGLWYVIEVVEYSASSQSSTRVSKLDFYLYSNDYDVRYMRWEYMVINKEKFKAQEDAEKGRYFYKLKR